MGKRYRKNYNGEWEEVDEQAEAEAIGFLFGCVMFISLGIVIWTPFQLLAGELPFINNSWLCALSIVMPCVIASSLAIYGYACDKDWTLYCAVGAFALILVDLFMLDRHCLALYFQCW